MWISCDLEKSKNPWGFFYVTDYSRVCPFEMTPKIQLYYKHNFCLNFIFWVFHAICAHNLPISSKIGTLEGKFMHVIKLYFGNHIKRANAGISCNIGKSTTRICRFLYNIQPLSYLWYNLCLFSLECKFLFCLYRGRWNRVHVRAVRSRYLT